MNMKMILNDAIRTIERDSRPMLYRLEGNIILAAFSCMKLVVAHHIVRCGLRDGLIPPLGTIVETTSGNLGLGLARAGRAYEVPVRLVGDPAIDTTLRARFELLGAQVDIVGADATGSYQKPRLRRLEELRQSIPGAFWVQQYDNPLNAESYLEVADDIHRRLGAQPIEHVVSPHGSGGSGAGLTGRLRERGHRACLVAVDTPGSVLFGCADRPRLLRGLGNSILPRNVRHQLVDEVHWVPASLAFHTAVHLFSQLTLDVGPTSGAAVLVAREIARRHPNETILVICPDNGERYRNDVLSPAWLAKNGLVADPISARPYAVAHPSKVGDEWTWMEWGRRGLDQVVGAFAFGGTR